MRSRCSVTRRLLLAQSSFFHLCISVCLLTGLLKNLNFMKCYGMVGLYSGDQSIRFRVTLTQGQRLCSQKVKVVFIANNYCQNCRKKSRQKLKSGVLSSVNNSKCNYGHITGIVKDRWRSKSEGSGLNDID